MASSLKVNDYGYKELKKALEFLKQNEVYVGVSEETSERPSNIDGITNAQLLFIHTNGSPVNNVPARPVVEPAIEKDNERLIGMLKKVALLAMSGDFEAAIEQLRLTGMRGQNVVRAYFTDEGNGWPPNAPSVAAAKIARGSTNPRPLIDTGELRKSITYFINSKGRKMR